MSVNTTEPRLSVEAGNDVETDFDFGFKIFAKTDIKCWKVSATGVYTPGVVDVDYTVTFDTDAETGTVSWTVAPVTGGYSVIAGSELPNTQGVIFSRAGVTPSRTTKTVADKLTILIQQLSDTIFGRAIMLGETPVNQTPPTVEAPVASRIVAWNAAADALVSTTKTLTTFQDDVDNTAANATAAAASAATASTQAGLATTAKTNAETAETNAETAETNAAASAAAAAASAAAALASEVAAGVQAGTASGHAFSAQTAQTNAETAETNAETAQTAAEAARDTAVTAKNDAVTAKNAALISQTAAGASAAAALVSEGNALTSANNAAASAVTAAAVVAALNQSGTFAARPAAPATLTFYTATDQGNAVSLYVPAAAVWIALG